MKQITILGVSAVLGIVVGNQVIQVAESVVAKQIYDSCREFGTYKHPDHELMYCSVPKESKDVTNSRGN